MKLVAFGVTSVVLALAVDPAEACSELFNETVLGEGAPDDVTPPLLTVTGGEVGWRQPAGICVEQFGFVVVNARVSDTASPAGIIIEVAEGNLSQSVFPNVPERPDSGGGGGDYHIYRFDSEIAAVDVVLNVRAVDRAGNRSEPVPIALRGERPDPSPGDEGGCAAGGGRGAPGGAMLLGALALLTRRRARAHAATPGRRN